MKRELRREIRDLPREESQQWPHKDMVELFDVLRAIDQLEEPEVLSQELPVIPKLVAEWIEGAKQDELPLHIVIERFINKGDRELEAWKGANKNVSEIVARAWLDGYRVEEEQKYYVLVRDEEYGGLWFLSKKSNGDISIGVSRNYSEVDWDTLKLTEQEIKDYDSRYLAFAEPVEELEK